MQRIVSKRFKKDFDKLPKPIQKKVVKVLRTFSENPTDPTLRRHRLTGKWHNHYSIDVTGDVRAVYLYIEKDIVNFVAVGTHSELYG